MLGAVKIGILSRLSGLAFPLTSLPVGTALRRVGSDWMLEYFDVDFVPTDGNVIAAPRDHALREEPDRARVHAFSHDDGELSSSRFFSGLGCIPIWCTKDAALPFGASRADGAALHELPLRNVMQGAANQGFSFLAVDHMTQPHEIALVVRP